MVFGALCVLAAIQSYFLYPETAKKSLEEVSTASVNACCAPTLTAILEQIEEMFRPGGPKPWRTKPGDSHLDASVGDVVRRASLAAESDKPQVVHKDGTIGAADSDSDRKEEV